MILEIRTCRSLLLIDVGYCCVEWSEVRKSNAIFKVVECGRREAAKIRITGEPRGSGGAEKDKDLKVISLVAQSVTFDQSEPFWPCRLYLKGLHHRCASISYINFLNFAFDRC